MFLKRFDVFIDFEDSCSMATADKCTGAIPPGAYDAFNDTSLLEVTKNGINSNCISNYIVKELNKTQ